MKHPIDIIQGISSTVLTNVNDRLIRVVVQTLLLSPPVEKIIEEPSHPSFYYDFLVDIISSVITLSSTLPGRHLVGIYLMPSLIAIF